MAKFCVKCGKKLEEGKECPDCSKLVEKTLQVEDIAENMNNEKSEQGKDFEDGRKIAEDVKAEETEVNPKNQSANADKKTEKKPKKTSKFLKILKLTLLFVVILGVICVSWWVYTEKTGPKGVLKKTMQAYEAYDIDGLILISSDMYFYGDMDVEQEFKFMLDRGWDLLSCELGENYEFSYEVKEMYPISGRQLYSVKEKAEQRYSGFNINDIEKIVVADLEITGKKDEKEVTKQLKVFLSKEEEGWRFFSFE